MIQRQSAPRVRATVLFLGVTLLIAGAFVVFRDRIGVTAQRMAVSDCFDMPATAPGERVLWFVSTLPHRPCGEPHDAEVVFVGAPPAGATTEAQIRSFVKQRCLPALEAYTRGNEAARQALELQWFAPISIGRTNGDGQVICFAIRSDGGLMTGSVKTSD
jgi:hypothetical protein